MTLSLRIGRHLRANVIGYLALFVALTGVSYAATKVTSKQIAKDAVKSKHIKDGQVGTAEVADNGITGADIDEASLQNVPVLLADGSVTTIKLADQAVTIPKLAFDPATQAELDALGTAGTINVAGNPIDFSKLKNVPADFADGVDNTGAAPANNSLGAAEPPATDDQIVDGSIDAQDVDASVAETAASQTFTGENTMTDTLALNLADPGERLGLTSTRTGADATIPFFLTLINNSTAPTMHAAQITNAATSTQPITSLLQLANADDQAVTTGVEFPSTSGGIATAVKASDPDIGTAIDIGANDIQTSAATISSTELEKLDGDPTRTVSIPLTAFLNVDDNAPPDFTPSDGIAPDFGAANDRPYIEWDDDSDGAGADVADTDRLAAQFIVPQDYASGGTIRLFVRTFGTGGPQERMVCDASSNDGAFGTSDFALTGVPAVGNFPFDPVVTYAAGSLITLRCNVDDGLGGNTSNDNFRMFGASFRYSATR